MPFRCQRKLVRYHFCHHDAPTEYIHCGGEHNNAVETMAECWGSQTTGNKNKSTVVMTSMDTGGVCCRDCDAEFIGFYCCLCEKFVDAAAISRNSENSLVHMVDDVEHEFCNGCFTKNF
jgi:hypothetical protein